jgi:signal transduction histidine kinase
MNERKFQMTRVIDVLGRLAIAFLLVERFGLSGVIVVGLAGVLIVLARRKALHIDRRLAVALAGTALLLGVGGSSLTTMVTVPVLIYLLLQVSTTPLARVIARSNFSVRWKFELAISFIGLLFLIVTIVTDQAMTTMHQQLHDIQELALIDHNAALAAVNTLEDEQHGILFELAPLAGLFAVAVASVIGASLARSVIDPVHHMEEGMQRMGAGDFSRPIRVLNRDELGVLAKQINRTADELVQLQDAVLAEERRRAVLERMNQVATAQESERSRIARDLHDGLGPSLAGLGNKLRACTYILRSDPEQAEREVGEVADLLKGHIQEIRALSHDLRPVALDRLGLVGAIKEHLESMERATGLRTSLDAPSAVELDRNGELAVFRIVQECLTNVQRHAGASSVAVELADTGDGMRFSVRDDGSGFDPALADDARGQTGTGLRNMRERASIMGWPLTVRTSPGEGCEVSVVVPEKEALIGVHSRAVGG